MTETTPLSAGRQGEGWHLELRRHRLLPLAVAGLAVVCVAVATVQLASGSAEVGVLLLMLAPAFATAPWWRHRRRQDPYCGETEVGPALVLPLNPRTWAFAASSFLLGAAAIEAGGAVAVRAADEGDPMLGIVLLSVFAAFGLVLWCSAFVAVRSHSRRDLGLLLTRSAVVVNGGRRPVVVPWAVITGVRSHWVRRADNDWFDFDDEVVNLLTIEVRHGSVPRPPRALDVSQLACRPEDALEILRSCLRTPAARAELGTHAASQPPRSGRPHVERQKGWPAGSA